MHPTQVEERQGLRRGRTGSALRGTLVVEARFEKGWQDSVAEGAALQPGAVTRVKGVCSSTTGKGVFTLCDAQSFLGDLRSLVRFVSFWKKRAKSE